MFEKRKRIILICTAAVLFAILTVWIAWGNKAPKLSTYRVASPDLPESFNGFRIVQISDLHNAEMGKDNEKLISIIKQADPNIIVITGDMIDSRKTKMDVALSFAREAVKIAPCYYASGNHESRVIEYIELKNGLTELGVTVLEDEKVEIELSGETITLIGAVDPSFKTGYSLGFDDIVMNTALEQLMREEDGYTVLLSHRPELFEVYAKNNIDLVFSGHVHGGQFRIPFIGGVVAPQQGFLPKYDAGVYTQGNTNMVVSRGIGNSVFPFRINNRPDVVLVELTIQDK